MGKPRRKAADDAPVNVPPEDRAANGRLVVDGFVNALKGIGTVGRDPAMSDYANVPDLEDEQLESAYRGNAIAARIVDLLPAEALRQGWTVRVDQLGGDAADQSKTLGDKLPLPDDEDDDGERKAAFLKRPGMSQQPKSDVDPAEANRIADEVREYLRRLSGAPMVRRGFSLGRLFGGALAIAGFGSTTNLEKLKSPIKDDAREELRWLIVHDRRVAIPGPLDADPSSANFGKPVSYTVTILDGTKSIEVHASRVLRFSGRWVPSRFAAESGSRSNANLGWDDSVLLGCWNALKHFDMTHETTARVTRDFSRLVYRMKGLNQLIAANREDLIRRRFEVVELCQSILNALLLDADNESAEMMARPVTGLPELLDRFGVLLAASVGAPITLLLGLSPGGFGTGTDEDKRWTNVVMAYQDEEVRPVLERLCRWVFLDPNGPTKGVLPAKWSIVFPQVSAPTEKEKAEIRGLIADAWTKCVTAGVLLADEAAEGMFGGGQGFGLDVVLDREARVEAKELEAEQLEAETEAMLEAARNPPPVVGGKPGAPMPGKPGKPGVPPTKPKGGVVPTKKRPVFKGA